MEKACIEDGVVILKKEDARQLYYAFLSLCDYVEEKDPGNHNSRFVGEPSRRRIKTT